MVAYTTTYNLKKPTVADDEDVWGGYLNDSMDIIDDVLDGTVPVTGIDINSGTLDNVVIGGTTANTGTFTVLSATTSLGVTGNITVSGTVDGRDVAADGTKLDGIESGATADQTKADIDALGIAASTAATLATARNIALTGAVTGNVNFDGSGNVSIATTATSDPVITLTGAVTGSGTMTNLGNVSIATTATADPTLTLSGDASGSATFTNLGNATLSVTVLDDSHNHVISNIDGLQTALDGKASSTGSSSNDFSARTVYLANLEKANLSTDGQLGFDSSQGLLVYRTQQGTTGTVSVLDGANVDAGTGVSITNTGTGGTGTESFTFSIGQDVATSASPTFSNMYVGDNIYHNGDTDTRILFGTNTITMQTGGSSEITVNTTGVRLGDTGNGYFQPVSGNYGSVQIDGGAHTGYEGYSIGGRAVFMHDNGSNTGIYNDVNNEWMVQCVHNGTVHLFYNGSSKLDTLSNGVSINGNLYVDNSVAEDWDSLSGTTPTCNVDAAGAFSLTMTGNTTFTFSGADNNWSQGFVLQLTGNGGTVTWPTSVDWAGGTAPDAPASGETDIYVFWTRDGGTTWYGVQSIDAAA